MIKNKFIYNKNTWAANSYNIINKAVIECLSVKSNCNILLTGGRSANALYKFWAKKIKNTKLDNFKFYLTDERDCP